MIAEKGIDCKGKHYQRIETGRAYDYTGKRNDRLTVLWRVKILNHNYDKQVFWLCQCTCGNLVAVASTKLTRANSTRSCGCLQKESISKLGKNSRTDLTGYVINGITFLKYNSQYKIDNHIKSKNAYWDCKCKCGKIFTANSGEILQNRILSCGCLGTRKSNGEKIIENILKEHNINYVYDLGYFEDLKLPSGMIGRYDFILLDEHEKPYRIIEFDGKQHYKKNNYFDDSKESFEYRQLSDKIKDEYALQHNIPLIRIPYTKIKQISWETIMGDQFLVKK